MGFEHIAFCQNKNKTIQSSSKNFKSLVRTMYNQHLNAQTRRIITT